MSLWAVKDVDGWFWDFTDEGFYEENDTRTAGIPNRDYANQIANEHNGTLTEYVQKSAPIVVSEEESEMLERAKASGYPVSAISGWCYEGEEDLTDVEDRLMRAYVNGWTAEKPKRYFVRVPHTNRHYYYQKCDSGEVIPVWDMETEPPTQFTEAEIEHYGLQDCEKVVCADSARTTGEVKD